MSRRDGRYAKHGTKKWGSKRRQLGQNFLRDSRIARQIVAGSGADNDDLVVELGAGGGMLTRELARVAGKVVAVEFDLYWAAHLERRFSDDGNVLVVWGDALEVRLPEEPFMVVANIPFHATTSILHRLLDNPTTPLKAAHLLVQKQVALKHARSSPTTLKTLNWSPWYEFSTGLVVPAGAFHPKPRVDACLMVAAKRAPPFIDPRHRHLFRALVRRAFDRRGNSLGRALRPIFTRTQLRRLANDNDFSLDSSPSTLTVHQWAGLFDFMVRMVPQDRWPSQKGHARRKRRRR